MSAVLINVIETTEFTSNQIVAFSNALRVATEILEARDITLLDPAWRIISDPNNRARFSTIDIGWADDKYDESEMRDMYEVISGPGQDKVDVFAERLFCRSDTLRLTHRVHPSLRGKI